MAEKGRKRHSAAQAPDIPVPALTLSALDSPAGGAPLPLLDIPVWACPCFRFYQPLFPFYQNARDFCRSDAKRNSAPQAQLLKSPGALNKVLPRSCRSPSPIFPQKTVHPLGGTRAGEPSPVNIDIVPFCPWPVKPGWIGAFQIFLVCSRTFPFILMENALCKLPVFRNFENIF